MAKPESVFLVCVKQLEWSVLSVCYVSVNQVCFIPP